MKLQPIMDGHNPDFLRGARMNGERYYDPEFARREWQFMWRKTWHIAGRTNELQEPGDYLVHDFMRESVIVVKQQDGGIRAFYNSCGHRGQRLAWDSASTENFVCPYHGWVWGKDGILRDLPDPEDFPQGNPCGKRSLKETRCATWGGFVWYAMSDAAPSFADFLGPVPEQYRNYPMDGMIRVFWMKIDLETNWKFASENFAESYHTRTAHPQVPDFCDQDYWNARLEMFPEGHGRTIQPLRPSLRDSAPQEGTHPFDSELRNWGLDPAAYPDFQTKVMQGWNDLKEAKRRLGPARGFAHYAQLSDEQLTCSIHTTMFPNVTITFNPDAVFMQRTEPHPDDPNKCTFDLWCLAFPVEGATHTGTPMVGTDVLPLQEAAFSHRAFDRGRGVPELHGGVVIQDLMLAEGQQRGLHSQGYEDAYLAASETRVRFFHDIIDDYLEGRR